MSKIKIKVDFYNKKEKEKFEKNYPELFKQIEKRVGDIEVPIEDFKTYFLFRHQCEKNQKKFDDFEKQVERKWPYFEDYFVYDEQTKAFKSTDVSVNGAKEISESLGVAGALAISSTFFLNTTQADWRKIPEQNETDFDFNHKAAVDDMVLVVESKGTVTDDNSKASSVAVHKKNILDKKKDKSFSKKYDKQRDACYGVITVADPKNGLQAWLVDPPIEDINFDPYKYRLLSRLYFYNDFLRVISLRSYLSLLLPNRIEEISRSNDYLQFDEVPLIGSSFEKIKIRKSFIKTRSRILSQGQKDVVGHIHISSKNQLFFFGLEVSFLRKLINQRFRDLLGYKRIPSTSHYTVQCVISAQTKESFITLLRSRNIREINGFYYFKCTFELHLNSAGIYFGKSTLKDIVNE